MGESEWVRNDAETGEILAIAKERESPPKRGIGLCIGQPGCAAYAALRRGMTLRGEGTAAVRDGTSGLDH